MSGKQTLIAHGVGILVSPRSKCQQGKFLVLSGKQLPACCVLARCFSLRVYTQGEREKERERSLVSLCINIRALMPYINGGGAS